MFPSLCDYKGPCHKGKVAFSNRRYLDTQKLSVEKGGQTTGPRAPVPCRHALLLADFGD